MAKYSKIRGKSLNQTAFLTAWFGAELKAMLAVSNVSHFLLTLSSPGIRVSASFFTSFCAKAVLKDTLTILEQVLTTFYPDKIRYEAEQNKQNRDDSLRSDLRQLALRFDLLSWGQPRQHGFRCGFKIKAPRPKPGNLCLHKQSWQVCKCRNKSINK